MRWLLIWMFWALPVWAENDIAGEFDYYVLALSWSPNWCELEGDSKKSDQCHPRHDHGWILHGLWPQYHQGYPSYCKSSQRPPTRKQTDKMADIMGSSGLAWHQWKKHGVCTGLSAQAYFDLSRKAFEAVQHPPELRKLNKTVKLPASVIEEVWLKANPDLEKDGLTVTCKQGHIQEVRICLDRELAPVPCGREVVRDCTMKDATFTPIR